MANPIFSEAIRRYEQESDYSKHLDQKASNQIGFVGVIIALIGFILGSGAIELIQKQIDINFLIAGIVLLMISFGAGVFVLMPFYRKGRAILDIRGIQKDYGNENAKEQESILLKTYLIMIKQTLSHNNQKAVILYLGNALLLAGLIVSFIGFLPILQVVD